MPKFLFSPRFKWSFVVFALAFFAIRYVSLGLNLPSTDAPLGERVKTWIAAAECFQQTGTPLVGCNKGQIVPIELWAGGGDDRGHTLLLSYVSSIFSVKPNLQTLEILNLIFNALSFLCLWGVLIAFVGWLGASGVLLFLTLTYAPGPLFNADVPAIFPGIVALVFVSLLLLHRFWLSEKYKLKSAIMAGLLLAVCMLMRESLGLIGLLAAPVCYALLLLRRRIRFQLWRAVVLFAVLLVAHSANEWLFDWRDRVYQVPRAEGTLSHGIAHSLYIGLGTYPNPWNIRWEDTSGMEHAQTVNPKVVYLSNEYYDILKKLYFQRVREAPGTVIKIYLRKTFRILDESAVEGWGKISLYIVAFVGLLIPVFFSARQRKQWRQSCALEEDLMIVTLAVTALCLVQGILTAASAAYLYPIQVGLVLLIVNAFTVRFRLGHQGHGGK